MYIKTISTSDAFPAVKIRKEGFQKVFNVWTKSHLVTLRWAGGRQSTVTKTVLI